MIERLIYLILLSIDLTVIVLASFVLEENVKEKDSMGTIEWLVTFFMLIFLTINNPLFSWSICNYVGG